MLFARNESRRKAIWKSTPGELKRLETISIIWKLLEKSFKSLFGLTSVANFSRFAYIPRYARHARIKARIVGEFFECSPKRRAMQHCATMAEAFDRESSRASNARAGAGCYFRLFSVQQDHLIVAFAYWLMFTIALARVEIK